MVTVCQLTHYAKSELHENISINHMVFRDCY